MKRNQLAIKQFLGKVSKVCPYCKSSFVSRKADKQKFCSAHCSNKSRSKVYQTVGKQQASCHPERAYLARGLCKQCYYGIYNKDKKQRQQRTIAVRKNQLKKNFGITTEQWDKIFEKQSGKCPICLNPIYKYGNSKGKRAAAVDHDHKTKRVRGLLCYRCNVYKVGMNTKESAKKLVDYLASEFDGRTI